MPIRNDASGRRSLELKVELPGTPEQVWQAIATGPGISAWFVPTSVEERAGGAIHFGISAELAAPATVTAWEPPLRFGYEERGWLPGAPVIATEFSVEARGGGRCALRIVHSLFSSDAQWDDQLESLESGWPFFFEVLRIYLEHFPGEPAAAVRPTGSHPGPEPAAWAALLQALGWSSDPRAPGDPGGGRVAVRAQGAPALAGAVVPFRGHGSEQALLLRLDQPAPGTALLGVYGMAGQSRVALSLYFYGRGAAATAAREAPRWQAWLDRQFPALPPADG